MIKLLTAAVLLLASFSVQALTPLQVLNYDGAVPLHTHKCTAESLGYSAKQVMYCYSVKVKDNYYRMLTQLPGPDAGIVHILDFGTDTKLIGEITVEEFIQRQNDADAI